jgi:hypothetical protein
VSQSPTSIATADLDGDGDVDVLCTSPAGDANGRGSISFFSGLGNGSFLAEATINTGGLPQSLVVGDWNDDGRLDLATVNALSVSLVLSVEGGKFARPIDHASGTSATRLITADLDADGDLDLAANGTENAVHILLNHGTGRFGALIDLAVHLPIHFLAAEDLNGDTRLDLAALAVGDSRVLVIENLSRPFSSDQDRDAVPDECDPVSALPFRRGDANQDAKVNISDPVSILRHLFMAGGRLGCRKAADANDDGKLDLSDAVSILQFLFLGQGGLPEPFLSCGVDSTEDLLDCEAFLPCAA